MTSINTPPYGHDLDNGVQGFKTEFMKDNDVLLVQERDRKGVFFWGLHFE